ncbi:transcriptional repressor [Bradyrhizobium sp. LjRoot220]|uniref:Fur family transcriptional regulator n=1 Tax=Bradyrhizobium sp. LjRoot220 TaxID=3342284 RepID=UPI003ED14766
MNHFEQAMVKCVLRRTGQRKDLYHLMHKIRPKHFTAGQLHASALEHGIRVSLATVYNTIKTFELAGLVRNIAIHDHLSVYDTEIEPHAHLYNETTGEIEDLDPALLQELSIEVPDEYEISGLHLVFRLRAMKVAQA